MSIDTTVERSEDELHEKFGWKEGDLIFIKSDWHVSYIDANQSELLVQSWDGLQQHLLQNDPGAKHNMVAAFYRFLRFHPEAQGMPENLRGELQALGLLP